MDLHELRVFKQLAKVEHSTRARDQLHLSQSTVSQQIKLMEAARGWAYHQPTPPAPQPHLSPDALATIPVPAAGSSTVTCYVESSAGLNEGGRTGGTAIVLAILFLGIAPTMSSAYAAGVTVP
jgi:xanthine/uracil/vitamin C permease (AzgA family)